LACPLCVRSRRAQMVDLSGAMQFDAVAVSPPDVQRALNLRANADVADGPLQLTE